MSTEQRLRDAMQAIADPVEPRPDDWSRLQTAVAVQRRGRLQRIAISTVAAAALVAGVIAYVATSDVDDPTLRVVPPATERTDVDPNGLPRRVIAVAGDGRVDLLETSTGRVVRTIAAGDSLPDVQPTASIDDRARMAVYTSGAPEDGLQTMFRVDLPSGVPRPIGRGHKPTLSPDGRRLAYATTPIGDPHGYRRLVVRTIASGREQSWDLEPFVAGVPSVIAPASWSPDSRRLMYAVGGRGTFEEFGILDPIADRGLDEATKVPTSSPDGIPFAQPVFRGVGQVVVIGMVRINAATATTEPNPVIVIDPTTGRELERLLEEGGLQLVTFDPTGRHMLYLQDLVGTTGLMRRSEGTSTWIADTYRFADW